MFTILKAFRIKKDTIRGRGEKQKELMVLGQKNISVNDQSSNSIENYVNIVYSVKIYISLFYYIVVLLIVVLTVHILKIYIYCFWKKNSRNKR